MTSSDGSSDNPSRAEGICAYAQIGALEIGYTRAGRGAPVILLCDGRVCEFLQRALAAHFCVIAPIRSAVELAQDVEQLREFIDALGLVKPALVVQPRWAAGSLALGLDDTEALAGLAILCRRHCECGPAARDAMGAWHRRVGAAPLLHAALADDVPGAGDLAALLNFLGRS